MYLKYRFIRSKIALFAKACIEKVSYINLKSVSSVAQLQNVSNLIEKAVRSNLTMFVIKIRPFASFSGHTHSVEVQTNRCLKLPKKYRRHGFYERRVYYCFYCKGDNFNVHQL